MSTEDEAARETRGGALRGGGPSKSSRATPRRWTKALARSSGLGGAPPARHYRILPGAVFCLGGG